MATASRPVVLALVGAGSAATLILVAAAVLLWPRHRAETATTAADGRRLTLEMGKADNRADISKPVRCFVDGKVVGQLAIADCAARNGVDPKALDLGLDQSGALAAGENVELTPAPDIDLGPAPRLHEVDIPELRTPSMEAPVGPPPAPVQRADLGRCMDFGRGWTAVADRVPLGACVLRLFDGHCVQPGQALYGRWGDRTVRLVPGRVEISSDNRSFHPLAPQGPGCSLPAA